MNFAQEISKLTSWGLSLIPANESGDKRALVKWKDKPPLGWDEIVDYCDRKGNYAVAVKTGEYGRIVCFDIDVKYKAGFDGIFLGHIREVYGDVLERGMLEKTPSGGYHIFFRVKGDEPLPVVPKIASREATDIEKEQGDEKPKCFLELKSVGGLAHIFPSVGYTRISGELSGEGISYSELISLINVGKSYNEVLVQEKKIRPTKDRDFYEEGKNPYECYDDSEEGAKILDEYGWNYINSRGEYDYYSKPDKKDKGVSISFHRGMRFYKVFTTTTELEAEKIYSPSNLLCKLKFGGDKSELYGYLVSRGFGQIQRKIERNIVRRAAMKGEPLPANASDEAQWDYDIEVRKNKELHPHGLFWKIDELGNIKISREDLYRVSREMGFRKHLGLPVQIVDFTIKRISEEYFFNAIKSYIGEVEVEILNAYEQFLQNSGKFTVSRLDDLDKDLIMKSSKLVSYKFYRNCYVKIESDSVECRTYDGMEKLIWEENIKNRDFKRDVNYKDSLYWRYLKNSIQFDKKYDYLSKCIGFYAHDYRDQEGYFMIATEQCEHPEDGGGSGKNIFWALFSLITTFKSTAAAMVRKDNALLQSWDYQRVFILSDMPKDYELIFFKDLITDGAVVRKLYRDEFSVDIEDMPKLGGSSNYSFDDTDPGLKRRIRPIEFTEFYTKAGGVKRFHGKMFPKEWELHDFESFDNIMIDCIQQYLMADCIIEKPELTEGGWVKQFSMKFRHLYEFITQNIDEWKSIGKVSNEYFRIQYEQFRKDNNVTKPFLVTTINVALSNYCSHNKIIFNKDGVWKDSVKGTTRGKIFGEHKEEVIPF